MALCALDVSMMMLLAFTPCILSQAAKHIAPGHDKTNLPLSASLSWATVQAAVLRQPESHSGANVCEDILHSEKQ